MSYKQAEYESLREELISHQSRRESVLSIGLTLAMALVAGGIEFKNPYLLLAVLLIVFAIRVQITHIHAGIQRIATYLRVVHEEDNPDLNWETTSYHIRSSSLQNQSPQIGKFKILITPAFSPMEYLLGLTGVVSVIAATLIIQPKNTQMTLITLIVGGAWLLAWLVYGYRTRELRSMVTEEAEARLFRDILKRAKPTQDKNGEDGTEGKDS
ncbi:MAG: hypothetical protein H6667_25570 [Ardenticatenaceae bacterium]|nr:hypothetical protein [Ardenticatenaceae bacterium]